MRSELIICIAIIVWAVDQISKGIIKSSVGVYGSINIFNNFNIVHVYNRGVTFSLFSSSSFYAPYLLSATGFCIIVWLAVWAFRSDSVLQRVSLAVIIGGAAGNIQDRLLDGAVTDFLDFHIGAYHWPAFNLADAAIVCGAAGLMLEAFIPAANPARQAQQRRKTP